MGIALAARPTPTPPPVKTPPPQPREQVRGAPSESSQRRCPPRSLPDGTDCLPLPVVEPSKSASAFLPLLPGRPEDPSAYGAVLVPGRTTVVDAAQHTLAATASPDQPVLAIRVEGQYGPPLRLPFAPPESVLLLYEARRSGATHRYLIIYRGVTASLDASLSQPSLLSGTAIGRVSESTDGVTLAARQIRRNVAFRRDLAAETLLNDAHSFALDPRNVLVLGEAPSAAN